MKTPTPSGSRRRTKWNPWGSNNKRLLNAALKLWELKQRNKPK